MSETEYSLKDVIEKNHGEVTRWLEKIETQTAKTNGRVTKLEAWRNRILGAMSLITIIILPLIFMMANKVFAK